MIEEIKIIDGAIDQIRRMMKGETIELRGLHNLKINRGKITDEDFLNRISLLEAEKLELQCGFESRRIHLIEPLTAPDGNQG